MHNELGYPASGIKSGRNANYVNKKQKQNWQIKPSIRESLYFI